MAEKQAIYQMRITPGMEFIMGPEGRRAEQEALSEDKDKSYRVLLNIVGKERQGKTSLRKMLSWEAFDPNEESTVGIDQELVETIGVRPESSWSKVDMHKANEEEFDILLGRHILKRLKSSAAQFNIWKALAPIVCFLKIATVTYVVLAVYFYVLSCPNLKGYPWHGFLIIGVFIGSGLAFGTREGFGIAVGIFHQLTLCEILIRWKLDEKFLETASWLGSPLTMFLGYVGFGLAEIFIGLTFGMSFGVGIDCTFCLAQPPEIPQNPGLGVLSCVSVHLFIAGCFIGLGSIHYRNVLLYIVVPSLSIVLQYLPEEHAFMLFSGIGCGHCHGISLAIGQNTYYLWNQVVKQITSVPILKRLCRHIFGFIPGFIILKCYQWDLQGTTWGKVCSAVSLVLTIEVLSNLSRRQAKAPCPIKTPSKVIGARVMNATLKIVIRDFAGHPLYYSAHHLYMTGQCMYILVFSMKEARADFDAAFAHLLQWMYSIYVHHTYPDVRVFIVGTHRDDPSLSKTMVDTLGKKIKDAIPREFYNMVVWNEDDTPLFPVENSVRSAKDVDHLYLRKRILHEVRVTNSKQYPLKYFFFYRLIEDCRKSRILIQSYDKLYKDCQSNECQIRSVSEFEDMLTFFTKTGEIIFNSKDNILKEFVIFDPHAIVQILSELITVPSMCQRERHMLSDWDILESFGICSEKLLKEAMDRKQVTSNGIDRFEHAIHILSSFNLLCQIQTKSKTTCFLIPALLPKCLAYPENYWKDVHTDSVFLVQCSPSFPVSAFQRLVCVCATFDASIMSENGDVMLNACQSKALFTYNTTFSYKLELIDTSGKNVDTSVPLCDAHFLKIVIRSEVQADHREMLCFLWTSLKKIIARDYAKCRLKMGVHCPCPSPHQNQKQDDLHMLPLLEDRDNLQENDNHHEVFSKDFWCRARKVSVRQGKAVIVLGNDLAPPTPMYACDMSTLLSDLPYNITSKVCSYLDIPSPLNRDWTYIAGVLGKTLHDVELLRFRCPLDPCGALLQDWISSCPNTTVGDFVGILRTMQRHDVISILGFEVDSSHNLREQPCPKVETWT